MSRNSPLPGVIFDLDGTIAETHPMAISLIGGTIASHGGPDLTPEQVIALFGPNEQGVFRNALGDAWVPAWEAYLSEYVEAHSACPEPFPGMLDILEALTARDCRIGLISGKTRTTAMLSLEVLGIAHHFSGVQGGSIDGIIKADCIRTLAADWGIACERLAYVGDTAFDIRESRAAGVTAVAAAWSAYADREALTIEGPDVLFDDLAAFAEWLGVPRLTVSPG
ncbi:HAD hydrolase-like protein [bacterium]|nr:HAD hydrolase-like protein [bacterium]